MSEQDADALRIKMATAMQAVERFRALIAIGQGKVDSPPPGSELADVLLVLALVASPEHQPRRPCLN